MRLIKQGRLGVTMTIKHASRQLCLRWDQNGDTKRENDAEVTTQQGIKVWARTRAIAATSYMWLGKQLVCVQR